MLSHNYSNPLTYNITKILNAIYVIQWKPLIVIMYVHVKL